jgi:hypothetical protein
MTLTKRRVGDYWLIYCGLDWELGYTKRIKLDKSIHHFNSNHSYLRLLTTDCGSFSFGFPLLGTALQLLGMKTWRKTHKMSQSFLVALPCPLLNSQLLDRLHLDARRVLAALQRGSTGWGFFWAGQGIHDCSKNLGIKFIHIMKCLSDFHTSYILDQVSIIVSRAKETIIKEK